MVLLNKSEEWQRGFAAGLAYILMLQQCPYVCGTYDSMEEEQLFLFAHQLGYDVEWVPMKGGKSEISFTLSDKDS